MCSSDLAEQHGRSFMDLWHARDAAVVEGLQAHAPAIVEPLIELGPLLWPVVDALPAVGRVFFAAHRAVPRPEDPLLSGWHAVNCIREWRGDTHWALIAAADLDGPQASILHNAHMRYEADWLPRSRGIADDDIAVGLDALEARGLADRKSTRLNSSH